MSLKEVLEYPVTLTILLFLVAVWLYLWNYNYGYLTVGINYEAVVQHKQYWRAATATFSHVSLLHLFFNVYSAFDTRYLEQNALGHVGYLKAVFVLAVVSNMATIAIQYVLIRFFRREDQRQSYALGYSGVLFGLLTIVAVLHHGSFQLFGTDVPRLAYPFILLGLTSLLIPNASFVGHLAGIIAGFAYAYGLFEWMSNYLFACLAFWTAVFLVSSVKKTTTLPLPCISLEDDGEFPMRVGRMVNGRLVYGDDNAGNDRNGALENV